MLSNQNNDKEYQQQYLYIEDYSLEVIEREKEEDNNDDDDDERGIIIIDIL